MSCTSYRTIGWRFGIIVGEAIHAQQWTSRASESPALLPTSLDSFGRWFRRSPSWWVFWGRRRWQCWWSQAGACRWSGWDCRPRHRARCRRWDPRCTPIAPPTGLRWSPGRGSSPGSSMLLRSACQQSTTSCSSKFMQGFDGNRKVRL